MFAELASITRPYLSHDNVVTGDCTLLFVLSARIVWRGPRRKVWRPEDRRCTLIIENSSENQYLREKAVRCLADHEIGTHFVSLISALVTAKRIFFYKTLYLSSVFSRFGCNEWLAPVECKMLAPLKLRPSGI